MGALRFVNPRAVDAASMAALSTIEQRQMARAATVGFGATFTTAREFIEQCGDGEFDQCQAQLWDVADGDAADHVLFQCWVYLADTATVFLAGTDQDAGVGMSEGAFERHGAPGTDALASALQAAFDALPKA